MEAFLDELNILLEWAQGTNNIDLFETEFTELVHEHRRTEGVIDIANIVAYNYDCHKYNRTSAIIHNMEQWKKYKELQC